MALKMIKSSERVSRVRNIVLEKVKNSDNLKAFSNFTLDWSKLAFSSDFENQKLREFELVISETGKIAGYGASETTVTGLGDSILEYVFLQLIDGTCIEAWTYTENAGMTYIAIDGSDFCQIKSQWHKNFLGRWRSNWKLYIDEVYFGEIKTGGYLLLNSFFYCKHHVSWDSLQLRCENGRNLPIHLATNEKPKDFIWAATSICSLGLLRRGKKALYKSNLVIPQTSNHAENDKVIRVSFLCNIVFRTMFFDMAVASRT